MDVVMCKHGSFALVLSCSQFLSKVCCQALHSSIYAHLHLIFWTCSNHCIYRWLTQEQASCQQREKHNIALFIIRNKSAKIGLVWELNLTKLVNLVKKAGTIVPHISTQWSREKCWLFLYNSTARQWFWL